MPKVTKKIDAEAGRCTVNVGVCCSANYNSMHFDVGLDLPFLDGETPKQALSRTEGIVRKFYSGEVHQVLDDLNEYIADRKNRR